MKIAVIGAAGKSGRLIASEAKSRGFDVTAIVKPGSADRLDPGYSVIEKSLFDLTAEDLKGFDAVVDAFGSFSYGPGSENLHITSLEHLITVFKELPEVRLLVVGGAGSLYVDENKSGLVADTIPEKFRGVPAAMEKAFAELKESGVFQSRSQLPAQRTPYRQIHPRHRLPDHQPDRRSCHLLCRLRHRNG